MKYVCTADFDGHKKGDILTDASVEQQHANLVVPVEDDATAQIVAEEIMEDTVEAEPNAYVKATQPPKKASKN